jgi:SAM-dependent methyltransferase
LTDAPALGPLERLVRVAYRAEDALFERRYGLDLNASIAGSDLTSPHVASLAHATAYHAVWCATLRRVIGEARRTRIPFDTFVDLGAGKGKACFFVARKMRLPRIIGVEFAPALLAIAQRNRLIFGATNVRFEEADAATYALPGGTPLIFLFNPFDDTILRSFLTTNAERLRGSRALIAYANDVHRAVLLELGFMTVRRLANRRLSFYRPPA